MAEKRWLVLQPESLRCQRYPAHITLAHRKRRLPLINPRYLGLRVKFSLGRMHTFARTSTWYWNIIERSLIIRLGAPHRVLSWASLGGGMRRADTIINHQVMLDDRASVEHPR